MHKNNLYSFIICERWVKVNMYTHLNKEKSDNCKNTTKKESFFGLVAQKCIIWHILHVMRFWDNGFRYRKQKFSDW